MPHDAPAHYPHVTRGVLRLFEQGALPNVAYVDVEPAYGYVTRLTYRNGAHRVTYGNDMGLNLAGASRLASDKGHTKYLLRQLGIACATGAEFALPWWFAEFSPNQIAHGNTDIRTSDQAAAYVAEHLGYPVYVKPVKGSRGGNIFKVYSDDELETVLQSYNEERIQVALIEAPLDMPDYRVVVLDGRLICAYQRVPLNITGDGRSTVERLFVKLHQRHQREGRGVLVHADDERMGRHLAWQGINFNTVLPAGHTAMLLPLSNLSLGGTSLDVSHTIHPRWVELAARIGREFDLRVVGLDLACEDIASGEAKHSVIEVNSSPGLEHYALSGEVQRDLVDRLYTKVFNTLPS